MHTRTTAGQATIEYIAAVALIAATFLVAGPAVGAPDVAKAFYGKFKLALCYAGGDVCSSEQAAREGLAPCPLQANLTGHDASATVFSVELGGRVTLTVTPRSDGTVSVVRAVGGSVGAAGGKGGEYSHGPVSFKAGADGVVRDRIQVARGWEFKDQATADRFLEHAVRNSIDEHDFPADWHSLEGGMELEGSLGASVGHSGGKTQADLVGAAASGSGALGGRLARDGTVTLYTRASAELESRWPMLPTFGTGRRDVVIEYTFNREGPRELALRQAAPSKFGNQITETVMRLDLRDPENLAAARALVDSALPWPPDVFDRARAVGERIRTHGIIETTTSTVDDQTSGASASGAEEVKFGFSYKHLKVHRTLVSATARAGGPFTRQRLDCLREGQG